MGNQPVRTRRPLPPPNPLTRRRHQKQVRRQIYLPVAGVVVFIIIGVYLLVKLEVGNLSVWSNIAGILVGILAMLIMVVVLTFAVTLVYAVSQILVVLPPYTRMAQDAIRTLDEQVRRGMDLSVRPIMTLKSYIALVESIFGSRNGRRR